MGARPYSDLARFRAHSAVKRGHWREPPDTVKAARHRAEMILREAVSRMDWAHQLAEDTCGDESRFHCETALFYRRQAAEQVTRLAFLERCSGP